jgi:putative protease
VAKRFDNWIEIETIDPATTLNNGDGLCYYTLQKELAGLAINRAESLGEGRWKVYPKDALADLKDLRVGVEVNRNRDMAWLRLLDRPSAERRIAVWVQLSEVGMGEIGAVESGEGETAAGIEPGVFELNLIDEDGCVGSARVVHARESARNDATDALRSNLGKLGNTIYEALDIAINLSGAWFLPASVVNKLRRDAVADLDAARAQARVRPQRASAVEPPVAYPEDTLSYLANVSNHKARDFYARHGVKLVAAAFEAHEEDGEVSLMITKHCVRFSLSLCPKQAKGVVGVSGTVKAAPLTLMNGSEKLTLRFDCKPCEMHVVGKLKPAVAKAASPLQFYKTRP